MDGGLKMKTITLTDSQCESLADFIEDTILDTIRQDTYIDNINWLINMVDAYKKIKGAVKINE